MEELVAPNLDGYELVSSDGRVVRKDGKYYSVCPYRTQLWAETCPVCMQDRPDCKCFYLKEDFWRGEQARTIRRALGELIREIIDATRILWVDNQIKDIREPIYRTFERAIYKVFGDRYNWDHVAGRRFAAKLLAAFGDVEAAQLLHQKADELEMRLAEEEEEWE